MLHTPTPVGRCGSLHQNLEIVGQNRREELQPVSQKPRTRPVAPLWQIGLCDPV